MNGFSLHLLSAVRCETVERVLGFVGRDASGSFGILPGHARFMTVLSYGLSRFRSDPAGWQYLACPGAVLRFDGNVLTLSTRRYLCDSDHKRISALLAGRLADEEAALDSVKDSLQSLEQELFRRIRELERRAR